MKMLVSEQRSKMSTYQAPENRSLSQCPRRHELKGRHRRLQERRVAGIQSEQGLSWWGP